MQKSVGLGPKAPFALAKHPLSRVTHIRAAGLSDASSPKNENKA